jgi:hypothetical protein
LKTSCGFLFQSKSLESESLEIDHSAAAAAAAMNESKSLMIDLLQNKPENQLEHHSSVAMNERMNAMIKFDFCCKVTTQT